jgi:gliding motility-associated-like protein
MHKRIRIKQCVVCSWIALLFSVIFPTDAFSQSDPELIIIQEEYSTCPNEVTEVKVVITGIPPVSITYLYNDQPGNANSSTDTIFLELTDTGLFIITSYSNCCSDYIPTADTIVLNEYEAPGVNFTGGGFQCDIAQINPLVAHFEGTPPFILNCLINSVQETITTDEYSFTFNYPYDFQVITQEISDANCSQEFIDTAYFYTGDIPAPAIDGDTIVCVNSVAIYSVDNDMYYAAWSIPGIAVYYFDAETNGSFVRVTWYLPGSYEVIVKLINTESGCESLETSIFVHVNETPVLGEVLDTSVCINVENIFTISIPTETGDAVYWPTIEFIGATVTIEEAGTYPYILTNDMGCSDTSALVVINNCAPELHVPQAFTPNGDQINDYLELFGVYNNLNFSVYSPSGVLLFRSTGINDFWDGTSDGNDVPEGSYYWHAAYTDANDLGHEESGVVTIIR